MLALNKLPHLSNPLHKLERFKRVTDDKFAICIESKLTRTSTGTRVSKILGAWDAEHVETCPSGHDPGGLPIWFHGRGRYSDLRLHPAGDCLQGTLRHLGKAALPRVARHGLAAQAQDPDRLAGLRRRPRHAPARQRRNDRRRASCATTSSCTTAWPGIGSSPRRSATTRRSLARKRGGDRPEWIAGFPAAVVVDELFLERGAALRDLLRNLPRQPGQRCRHPSPWWLRTSRLSSGAGLHRSRCRLGQTRRRTRTASCSISSQRHQHHAGLRAPRCRPRTAGRSSPTSGLSRQPRGSNEGAIPDDAMPAGQESWSPCRRSTA